MTQKRKNPANRKPSAPAKGVRNPDRNNGKAWKKSRAH